MFLVSLETEKKMSVRKTYYNNLAAFINILNSYVCAHVDAGKKKSLLHVEFRIYALSISTSTSHVSFTSPKTEMKTR